MHNRYATKYADLQELYTENRLESFLQGKQNVPRLKN